MHNRKHGFKGRNGTLAPDILHHVRANNRNACPSIILRQLLTLARNLGLHALQLREHIVYRKLAFATNLFVKPARIKAWHTRKRRVKPVGKLWCGPPLRITHAPRLSSLHALNNAGDCGKLTTHLRLCKANYTRSAGTNTSGSQVRRQGVKRFCIARCHNSNGFTSVCLRHQTFDLLRIGTCARMRPRNFKERLRHATRRGSTMRTMLARDLHTAQLKGTLQRTSKRSHSRRKQEQKIACAANTRQQIKQICRERIDMSHHYASRACWKLLGKGIAQEAGFLAGFNKTARCKRLCILTQQGIESRT